MSNSKQLLSFDSPEFHAYFHKHCEFLPDKGETIHKKSGRRMGHKDKRRNTWYWRLHFNQFGYVYEHRLAHWVMTGEWPPNQVDHINGDGLDNRWPGNLRRANHQQQQFNARLSSRNKSGVRGVYQRGNRWIAELKCMGKRVAYGNFATKEEAVAFRLQAERDYWIW